MFTTSEYSLIQFGKFMVLISCLSLRSISLNVLSLGRSVLPFLS